MGELQERITSTKNGSITSVQAIYVPADDYTDPAPATAFAHLDATTNLSRAIAELGIYPAVDPLASTSRILDPRILGDEHYNTAQAVKGVLQRYKDLQDIIAILGIDELSDEDKLTVAPRPQDPEASCRSRSTWPSSSPAFPGKYVKLADTIKGFKEIVDGKHDELPEQAFYMQGTIEDVIEKAQDASRRLNMADTLPASAGQPRAPARGRAGDGGADSGARWLHRRAAGPCAAAFGTEAGRRADLHTRTGRRKRSRCTAASWKCCRIAFACWRMRRSSPPKSTSRRHSSAWRKPENV